MEGQYSRANLTSLMTTVIDIVADAIVVFVLHGGCSDFGFSTENEIAIVATSAEEIVELSRVAVAFAMEHGADQRRAKTVGLITEEMSGLYANRGFADGKEHRVNITDIYKKDMEEKGSTEDTGLTIVMRMTKDVKYAAAFGANNLIIRV